MDDYSTQGALVKLTTKGGCIVSSADCSELETADARARGDFFTVGLLGYVHRRHEWLQKHSRYARNPSKDCCEGVRSPVYSDPECPHGAGNCPCDVDCAEAGVCLSKK